MTPLCLKKRVRYRYYRLCHYLVVSNLILFLFLFFRI